MTLSKRRMAAGLRTQKGMFGSERIKKLHANSNDFTKPLNDLIAEFAYGTVWARGGISQKTRSLLCIGILTALNRPDELRAHLIGAISNGCTAKEVRETILHAALYCGFPAAIQGMHAAAQIFERHAKPGSADLKRKSLPTKLARPRGRTGERKPQP